MTVAPDLASNATALSPAALLAETYRRLATHCESLAVTVARPDSAVSQGWVTGAELVSHQGALDAFVGAEAARIRAGHDHTPRPDVAASRALHGYLWSVSLLMSGAWHLERRVPRIHPEEVRVHLETGEFEIVPGSFACLPDDPAAGLPGTRVLADEESLRAELRAAVVAHMRPLLTAIGPRLRRGQRALWGMAGDDLISGIWYLGRMLGQEDEALCAVDALLPGPVEPFPGGAAFRNLTTRDGERHPTRTRLGCCLYYTIRAAEACGTCPRVCDAERLRRLEADITSADVPSEAGQ
ncbi:(2Fe-2S)-binding protein [Streptomyces sp. NBC_01283]|uniref:(2Fe-2S)-binding protein n=1 Tax=Streptomyces sp. NBC_01283 TaxID=2903812 RepID=UPI00352C11B8|nr:(2Fe-2S)-binding protein [Streptomyces sp. NBC_01283]